MVNLNLEYKIFEIQNFNVYMKPYMLSLVFLMLSGGFVHGQSQAELELRLERQAKYEAMKVIQRYGGSHSLNRGTLKDKFFRLFSENATHVLDIPFYNQNNEDVDLLVREYMSIYERFFTESQNNRVEVRPRNMNVKRGNEGLAIEVYCEKKFFGKIDVLGSDVVYPEAQHLLFTLVVKNGEELMEHWNSVVNFRDRYASPRSLELKIQSVQWHPVQETYFLALIENRVKSALIENRVKSELIFPCEEQVKVADSQDWRLVKSETECWVVRDSNGTFIDEVMYANRYDREASQSEVLRPQKIPKRSIKPWSWQLGVGAVAKSSGSVADTRGNQASWGLERASGFQASVGYSLEQSNRFIWDVNFGILASNAQFEYTAQQIAFDEASVDPDGFQYIRQTNASDWIESISEKAVLAELSTLGLWAFSGKSKRKFWLGLQGGYSLGVWSQARTNSEAHVFHQGYYPALYGITIDDTGIYDFGSHNGSGSGQHQWKGSGQINVSGVIGLQVKPGLMLVGKVGGVRANRRAGDDELGYMDGTNTLNAASQQLQSLSLNGMAFSIGLRKRITGGDVIEKGCHNTCSQ